ncbi:MAG: hypothetical protein K2X49_13430, partial [Acetobacteraceae bacterium]|nr:hypothetical protein [Acetobacteraceae bacterium]
MAEKPRAEAAAAETAGSGPHPATAALLRAVRRLQPARDRRGKGLPRLWLFSDPLRLPDPCAA